MKQRLLTLTLILFAVGVTWGQSYSGGSGTSGDPYQIANLNDLQELQNTSADWSAYFIQTANIDATGTSSWDGGSGWDPVGNTTTNFTGAYNGDGYSISGLYVSRSTSDYIGLFGYINNASISNLVLTSLNIIGDQYVAGLAGYENGSTVISNCTIGGTINGTLNTGGCIGFSNSSGNITSTSFSGNVDADNSDGNLASGGFVGEKSGTSTISRCSSSGTITGYGRNFGGFVGWHDNGTIEESYSTMDVSNTTATQGRIGGFAGSVSNYSGTDGTVYNCYSTGDVSAPNTTNTSSYGIGGFVGAYFNDGGGGNQVFYSYAAGSVSAPNASTNVGGFSGEENDYGDAGIGNFWDTETSGWSTSYEEGSGETGATTAEMKDHNTFTAAGWDFVGESANGTDDYWDMDYSQSINSGYPYLSWEDGDDQSLPVELTSFTATAEDAQVTLRWVTASEINNEAFLLERSLDGETFELLAEIEGQGTVSEQTQYEYTDPNVFNGRTYYYRLADRDFNGVLTYHNTITATPTAADISKVSETVIEDYALLPAYPNPFNPITTIRFNVPNVDNALKTVTLSVYNLLGQKVQMLYDGSVNGGVFQVQWNGKNEAGIQQPSGVYLIQLQSDQFVKTLKITLLR